MSHEEPSESDDFQRYIDNNRDLWEGWTAININAPSYQTDEFKAGKTTLHKIELEEVGDVRGKTLLHLQCQFGLDTLSWARLGAIVTGVDFSPRAIDVATRLSAEVRVPGRFVCSEIYNLLAVLVDRFDIVFTSYGVLCWLPDLPKWADIVAHFLKPGGRFHIVEFHPAAMPFDPYNPDSEMRLKYPYFHSDEPVKFVEQGSFADRTADFVHDSYEWPHSLSDIINSLIGAGLQIEHFNEFSYSISDCFPGKMHRDEHGLWRLNENALSLPLMFSLKAVKSL